MLRELKRHYEFLSKHTDCEFVLATIIETDGSTYKKSGSIKIIAKDGSSSGLLSGGCLEAAFIEDAHHLVQKEMIKVYDTTSAEDRLFGYNLGCQGKIKIKFEHITKKSLLKKINENIKKINLNLFIIGAGIDIDPLYELTNWHKWNVKVYTQRSDLYTLRKNQAWNIDQLSESKLSIDNELRERSAVLLMSHNYSTDLEILNNLAKKPPGYTGILGPETRKNQMLKDLSKIYDTAWPQNYLKFLYGPMGTQGLGKGEDAIALSIVSELQKVFFGNLIQSQVYGEML